jgi:hypothetical protein
MKDDIARLIHLFKHPGAQVHWSNHYGVLNRIKLDAWHSSGPASNAANPLSCLAELFNNYEEFQPQNLMVAYIHLPRLMTSNQPTCISGTYTVTLHGLRAHGPKVGSTFIRFWCSTTVPANKVVPWGSGALQKNNRGVCVQLFGRVVAVIP